MMGYECAKVVQRKINVSEGPRPQGEPQARAAADAHPGPGWHGAGACHQPLASAAQGLSVLVARGGGEQTEPSVEHGHHLHPADAWLRLSSGDNRLVQQEGIELENQQHAGHGVLCGLFGRGITALRQP